MPILNKKISIILKKTARTITFYIILAILADTIILTSPVQASLENPVKQKNIKIFRLTIDNNINYYTPPKNYNSKSIAFLVNDPENNKEQHKPKEIKEKTKIQPTPKKIKWSGVYVLTAYNSEVGQTDSTPCITANGFDVCKHGIEDTIAANFLYFGQKVRIPDIFGDRIFIVRDRMNPRYKNRIDIWMKNKQDALKFGKKIAKIEIVQ